MENFLGLIFIIWVFMFPIFIVVFQQIADDEGSNKKGKHDGKAFRYALVLAILAATFIVNII